MDSLPSISILVVNWNGLHHLRDCLPSLFSQDYPKDRLEWLVVDNGSVDGSVEFIQQNFPEVRLLRNATNQGFAKPNNDAAKEAKGDYVALINNDMRADPGWLAEAVKRLDESSGRICVGSKILSWDGQRVDFNGGTQQLLGYAMQKDLGRPADESPDVEADILFACGGSMLVRRDVFLASGGFDEDYFAIFEDVDLGWRLWMMGYRVGLAPRSRVYHKLHGTFDRSREEKMRYLMHRNALWTIIKNYSDETLQKVLPVAVVQAVRRAVFFSGVDRSSFYFWAAQDSRMGHSIPAPEDIVWQCRDAMNHLLTLDDVFDSIPVLRAKRARIQALRKVSDEMILSLFKDPFRSIMQDFHYEATELDLIEHLRLADLFGPGSGLSEQRKSLAELASGDISRVREEVRLLEKQKKELELQVAELARALGGPPQAARLPAAVRRKKTPHELVREFSRIWRERGLREALRQTQRFLFS